LLLHTDRYLVLLILVDYVSLEGRLVSVAGLRYDKPADQALLVFIPQLQLVHLDALYKVYRPFIALKHEVTAQIDRVLLQLNQLLLCLPVQHTETRAYH